jgi:hypothetical protein
MEEMENGGITPWKLKLKAGGYKWTASYPSCLSPLRDMLKRLKSVGV